jgi:hypothetical protein
MDIKNVSNYTNNQVNGPADSQKEVHQVNPSELKRLEKSTELDKVSVSQINKNELSFAKVELEKLNKTAMENISEFRQKIQEYEELKSDQLDKLQNNDIHTMMNDQDVWSQIADKIRG